MADIVVKILDDFRIDGGPMKGAWVKNDEHRLDDTPELRQFVKDCKRVKEIKDKSRRKKTQEDSDS